MKKLLILFNLLLLWTMVMPAAATAMPPEPTATGSEETAYATQAAANKAPAKAKKTTSTDLYVLVTSASDLQAGDKVVFVSKDRTHLMTAQAGSDGGRATTTSGFSVDEEDNSKIWLESTSDAAVMTIEASDVKTVSGGETFALKTDSGYLYSGVYEEKGAVGFKDAIDEYSSIYITAIDETSGEVTMRFRSEVFTHLRYNTVQSTFFSYIWYGDAESDFYINTERFLIYKYARPKKVAKDTYTLVTSADDLEEGDQLVFANLSHSRVMSLQWSSKYSRPLLDGRSDGFSFSSDYSKLEIETDTTAYEKAAVLTLEAGIDVPEWVDAEKSFAMLTDRGYLTEFIPTGVSDIYGCLVFRSDVGASNSVTINIDANNNYAADVNFIYEKDAIYTHMRYYGTGNVFYGDDENFDEKILIYKRVKSVDTYTLVTSTDQLQAGDQLVLANLSHSRVMSLQWSSKYSRPLLDGRSKGFRFSSDYSRLEVETDTERDPYNEAAVLTLEAGIEVPEWVDAEKSFAFLTDRGYLTEFIPTGVSDIYGCLVFRSGVSASNSVTISIDASNNYAADVNFIYEKDAIYTHMRYYDAGNVFYGDTEDFDEKILIYKRVPAYETYELLTSTDQLQEGDQLVLATSDHKYLMTAEQQSYETGSHTATGRGVTSKNFRFNSDYSKLEVATDPDECDALVMTVVPSDIISYTGKETFALRTDLGYLYSGVPSDYGGLKFKEAIDEYSSVYIADIDSTTSKAVIRFCGYITINYNHLYYWPAIENFHCAGSPQSGNTGDRILIYRKTEKKATLAEFLAADTTFAGSDYVTLGGTNLMAVASFSDSVDNYLVVKDTDDAVYLKATPADDDKSYNITGVVDGKTKKFVQEEYEQNNWMLVNLGQTSPDQYVGRVLNRISGEMTYRDRTNPVMKGVIIDRGSKLTEAFSPYLYCPVNFTSNSSVPARLSSKLGNYFFVTPKRCEYVTITFAMYHYGDDDDEDGAFYVPRQEGPVNALDFAGGFRVDWSLNEGGKPEGMSTTEPYKFNAIVMQSPLIYLESQGPHYVEADYDGADIYSTGYVVYPLNITSTGVITGVNDVNVNEKTVKNVRYYNVMGMETRTLTDGVNIVVTTYTDGTTSSKKVLH